MYYAATLRLGLQQRDIVDPHGDQGVGAWWAVDRPAISRHGRRRAALVVGLADDPDQPLNALATSMRSVKGSISEDNKQKSGCFKRSMTLALVQW